MFNNRVREIWNANAEFWDRRMGEGNDFHKILIEPAQLKLLNIRAGDRVLDIACGNGQFARKMAELGARVTAVDFSDKFIDIARSKSDHNIEYHVIDAASQADLKQLTGKAFDSIVCTMALMDMESIEVLINHLPEILKKDGLFVFSILHPCFNSGEIALFHERDDLGGVLKNKYGVKISNYLVEQASLGIGMVGQPEPQYYFHRPVSVILKYFFQNGFVMDGYEEPSFKNSDSSDSIYDNVYKNIPAALVCRLRMGEKSGG